MIDQFFSPCVRDWNVSKPAHLLFRTILRYNNSIMVRLDKTNEYSFASIPAKFRSSVRPCVVSLLTERRSAKEMFPRFEKE